MKPCGSIGEVGSQVPASALRATARVMRKGRAIAKRRWKGRTDRGRRRFLSVSLAPPLQRSLLDGVDKSNHQDRNEANHAAQYGESSILGNEIPVHHRPGI